MTFVIDANILMSALISGKAFYRTIFNALDVVTPDFALIEIDKYRETILSKAKLKGEDMQRFTLALFEGITVLPNYILSTESIAKASRLIINVDPKDIPYLALAIQTNAVLITRDRPIYTAARQEGFRNIILFDDFLRQYL
ncbi:PIN domain-containing protein [Spirosoma sp. KUDC1026]|uniref:PIN domain-containing protein n=1 Tax=Spirosoma sp. KUDC1026 TaxID=2745947 RepID=UPI00159BD2AC|nr:PIN domain-containing protein [Spirosoma sp. KUDC1026]QKZ11113.1 PIN domain-containing protein [Spirosoma sp. KUDC1026]